MSIWCGPVSMQSDMFAFSGICSVISDSSVKLSYAISQSNDGVNIYGLTTRKKKIIVQAWQRQGSQCHESHLLGLFCLFCLYSNLSVCGNPQVMPRWQMCLSWKFLPTSSELRNHSDCIHLSNWNVDLEVLERCLQGKYRSYFQMKGNGCRAGRQKKSPLQCSILLERFSYWFMYSFTYSLRIGGSDIIDKWYQWFVWFVRPTSGNKCL